MNFTYLEKIKNYMANFTKSKTGTKIQTPMTQVFVISVAILSSAVVGGLFASMFMKGMVRPRPQASPATQVTVNYLCQNEFKSILSDNHSKEASRVELRAGSTGAEVRALTFDIAGFRGGDITKANLVDTSSGQVIASNSRVRNKRLTFSFRDSLVPKETKAYEVVLDVRPGVIATGNINLNTRAGVYAVNQRTNRRLATKAPANRYCKLVATNPPAGTSQALSGITENPEPLDFSAALAGVVAGDGQAVESMQVEIAQAKIDYLTEIVKVTMQAEIDFIDDKGGNIISLEILRGAYIGYEVDSVSQKNTLVGLALDLIELTKKQQAFHDGFASAMRDINAGWLDHLGVANRIVVALQESSTIPSFYNSYWNQFKEVNLPLVFDERVAVLNGQNNYLSNAACGWSGAHQDELEDALAQIYAQRAELISVLGHINSPIKELEVLAINNIIGQEIIKYFNLTFQGLEEESVPVFNKQVHCLLSFYLDDMYILHGNVDGIFDELTVMGIDVADIQDLNDQAMSQLAEVTGPSGFFAEYEYVPGGLAYIAYLADALKAAESMTQYVATLGEIASVISDALTSGQDPADPSGESDLPEVVNLEGVMVDMRTNLSTTISNFKGVVKAQQ